MPFSDLHLSDALLKAVADAGYTEPSAIQAAAIPAVLMGKDLIGVAQTGTGKTASFVLPMIDILAEGRSRARMPRSLILEPTRELAAQVAENFEKYGKYHKLSMALLIGGVAFGDQDRALEKGVDVLIATPGRLMDQHARGKILLSGVDVLVIDEADRMLDMGFIPDVEKICALLRPERQTLLFSATMPPPIKKLADRFMSDPKMVEVARPATTNKDIAQLLVPADARGKRDLLKDLLKSEEVRSGIIFCNRKTTVRDLAAALKRARLRVGQIHGDMEQADRIRELDRFKADEINLLVASDVAARGLDIKGVSHVFNFDIPWHPDDYVHRIGRTGRAGQKGVAISLVTADDIESIANIEKLTGQTIPRRAPLAFEAGSAEQPAAEAAEGRKPGAAKASRRKEERPRKSEATRPEARVDVTARPEARPESSQEAPQESGREARPDTRTERSREGHEQARAPRRGGRAEGRRDGSQGPAHDTAGNAGRDMRRGGRDRRDGDEAASGPGFADGEIPAFLMFSARG